MLGGLAPQTKWRSQIKSKTRHPIKSGLSSPTIAPFIRLKNKQSCHDERQMPFGSLHKLNTTSAVQIGRHQFKRQQPHSPSMPSRDVAVQLRVIILHAPARGIITPHCAAISQEGILQWNPFCTGGQLQLQFVKATTTPPMEKGLSRSTSLIPLISCPNKINGTKAMQ
jgi:hypothetical protein